MREQWHLHGGDELAVFKHVLEIGRVARDPVEPGQRDAPCAVTSLGMYDRVQGDQGHAQVRCVQGDAVLAGPQDRVHAGGPRDGGATGTPPALVAGRDRGVAEVAATGPLQEIPADGG
jgi:hypothetical protein